MATTEFRYFSAVDGHAVPRYGTRSFIGAERGPEGFVFNTKAVVAIPVSDFARFAKEYMRALKSGALVERNEKDWKAYEASRNAIPSGGSAKPEVEEK
jgi:hypothetical protein